MKHLVRASYGNDSIALIRFAHEAALDDVHILYNDTGWASEEWAQRVHRGEALARSYGFTPHRTEVMGLEQLVRDRKGWPRQGMQFCTQELKIRPSIEWLRKHDPNHEATSLVGVRRSESVARREFPEWSTEDGPDGSRRLWAPLVSYTDEMRDALVARAGFGVLPHRSMECFPCINSNRADLRKLATDEKRIAHIEGIEASLGHTSKGKPRTMFRPYHYMGATGIREIVRWAQADRGKFESLDDGNGSPGCEAGWCGT